MSSNETPLANKEVAEKPVCLPAGRYEFRDLGIYIGEWLDEKAVGLGLITKDKSQGEYTGLWNSGSEKSGVFLWPNAPGAMYEGEWSSNRRNGFGVFNREDWVIMGKFKDDFITTGVKGKENTFARFEGRFENGFPAFGVETYGDGGLYAGDYKNGIREGFGVRKSIPYGEVLDYYPEAKSAANSSKLDALKKRGKIPSSNNYKFRHRRSCTSERSIDVTCNSDDDANIEHEVPIDTEPYTSPASPQHGNNNLDYEHEILLLATRFKCGFVLTSRRSDLFVRRLNKLRNPRGNPFSCTPIAKRTQSLSDIFWNNDEQSPMTNIGCLRQTKETNPSVNSFPNRIQKPKPAPFETFELDLVEDDTVEVYAGEWLADVRHGYGVCERTDGLAYYGQWFKNHRHGLGHTRFQDGTFEQGRYQNGKLIYLALPVGNKPHQLIYNRHVIKEVQGSMEKAICARDRAHKKEIEAREQVSSIILDTVEKAKAAAVSARDYSLEARELVREMYPDFEQPGIKYLEDIVRMMRVTRRGSPTFEAALQSAKDVLAGIIRGLTRTGEEESDLDDQQPEEDLTLPPKFSSQINAGLKVDKKPISRAGSIRQQRRARWAKLHPQSRPQLEDAKTNVKQTTVQQKTASKPSDQKETKTQQQSKFGTSRFADSNIRRHIPKIQKRVNDVDDDSNSERSYIEIPDMAELNNQYEIPSFPITKLFANPILFSNHFDYYSANETPSTVSNVKMAAVDSPSVKPDDIKTESLNHLVENQLPKEDAQNSFTFTFRIPQWNWKSSQQPQETELLSNTEPKSNFTLSCLNRLIPGSKNTLEKEVSKSQIPITDDPVDSSVSNETSHELLAWFRSNFPLLVVITVNIFLLHIFFNNFSISDDGS